jgi:biopolymer transport protein TolQ
MNTNKIGLSEVMTSVINTPEVAEQINVMAQNHSIWHMVANADLVGKSVILILLIASIVSWAIIIDKYLKYKDVRFKMRAFENLFWSGQVLDMLYEKVKTSIDNPMASIFVAAMSECKRHDASKNRDSSLKVGLKERISQAMYLVRNREMDKMETHLGFLATVGSSGTFIGLFGTVWGIMHSFQSIASSNNTSLAVVAPGIAEALFATAIGLVAAIPAGIFYNLLSSQSNNIANRLADFSSELHTLLARAIDEEKL